MSKQLTQDGGRALIDPIDPQPIPEPPDPPAIDIQSPANGALVVGTLPGVAVTVSGSGWTPLRSRPAVKVKLGATDTFHDATSVTTPNLGGEYFWTYTGVTVAGGPITVTAQVIIGTGPANSATDSINLAVMNVPPVLGVDQPREGELFTGTPDGRVIAVSGTASSVFGFGANAITWNRDNGQATGTTPVVNNAWSTSIHVPKDAHSIKFTATDIVGNATSVTRNVTVTVPTAILDVSLIS